MPIGTEAGLGPGHIVLIQFRMPYCDLYIAASVTIGNPAANSDAHPRSNTAPVIPCQPKFTKREKTCANTASPLKKAHSPQQFLAHVCCDQMAGWIKMPLGTQVGLDPGNIALDGGPTSPEKGAQPHFSAHVCCGQTAG